MYQYVWNLLAGITGIIKGKGFPGTSQRIAQTVSTRGMHPHCVATTQFRWHLECEAMVTSVH